MTHFFAITNKDLTHNDVNRLQLSMRRIIGWIRLFLIVWVTLCATGPLDSVAKEKKEKVIDFEESLVEGMNKKPLDSLNQISEAERRRRRSHLYKKRAGFSTETYETVRTLRNVQ